MARPTALLTLLLAAGAAAQPVPANRSPLDSIDPPSASVVAQHSARDVALEVVFAPDGALLNWRCTVSPHPSFCAPTAAVAALAGRPTWKRRDSPDVFRLPITFWLPEDFDRDAPGAPRLPTATPRDVLSRWRDLPTSPQSEPGCFPGPEIQPELIGGLPGVQARVRYPEELVADGAEGRVFVQFVVDERGRAVDTDATPVVCTRSPDPRLCDAARSVLRTPRFFPARNAGVPAPIRYSLPLRYCSPDDSAPTPRAHGCG